MGPNDDWLRMSGYLRELHRFSRRLLPHPQRQALTAGEMELLSLLYLMPEGAAPLELSRRSGMKKEAVSRILRQLCAKGRVTRRRHPEDERSCLLSLTESGREELDRSCRTALQPLYDLRRQMGPEFEALFDGLCRANAQLDAAERREPDALL